jgi:hypothetical protein
MTGGPEIEVADRLYALPPREFVAERDAAVASARAAGDTATAAALAKLRRPTVAAWLVNLLALRRPELLAQLADLATALRAAQRELDGDQLRELSGQRRATVSALVATARSLALEVEPTMAAGKLPLAEVESTVSAALADTELAERVRSGRLVRAAGPGQSGETSDAAGFFAPGGFGELARNRLRLVTGGATGGAGDGPGATDGADPAEADRARREAVAAELAAAQAAAAAASAELERVTAAQREAKQELAEIDARLAELAVARAAAASRLAEAEAAGLGARRAVAATRRRVGEAEAAASALDPDGDAVS